MPDVDGGPVAVITQQLGELPLLVGVEVSQQRLAVPDQEEVVVDGQTAEQGCNGGNYSFWK